MKKKNRKKEDEASRLGMALAEAKRKTIVVEELNMDDDIVAGLACKKAQEAWPKYLEDLEAAVNRYLDDDGPEHLKVSIKIIFEGREGLVWAVAFEGAIRALLPKGFSVDEQTVYHPVYSFNINW